MKETHCSYCGASDGELHGADCPYVTGNWDMAATPKGDFPKYDSITVQLPPEVQPYKEDIRRFMDAMIYKLGKNAKKGRWEEMSINDVLRLLKGEVAELDEAANRGSMTEMMLESADVANFALILSAIAIERGK